MFRCFLLQLCFRNDLPGRIQYQGQTVQLPQTGKMQGQFLKIREQSAHKDAALQRFCQVKVLGVFDTKRMESMPDVPTLGELGYYDQWYGSARAIVAPKGTPQEIIDFYADAFKKAMEDPEYVDAAEKAGVTTAYMDPEETQKLLNDQYTFCTDVSSKLWNE